MRLEMSSYSLLKHATEDISGTDLNKTLDLVVFKEDTLGVNPVEVRQLH